MPQITLKPRDGTLSYLLLRSSSLAEMAPFRKKLLELRNMTIYISWFGISEIAYSYQKFLDWDLNYYRPLSTRAARTGKFRICRCWLPKMLILTWWRCSSGCYTLCLEKSDFVAAQNFQKVQVVNELLRKWTWSISAVKRYFVLRRCQNDQITNFSTIW